MYKSLLVSIFAVSISACVSVDKTNSDVKSQTQRSVDCHVNDSIQRNPIPKTPHNMSLPAFGQGVIGWATGEDGAKKRFENIQKSDLKSIQEKGTTLDMVKEWQAFYENEVQRNPCNPTAPYRAKLMKKIADLWVE